MSEKSKEAILQEQVDEEQLEEVAGGVTNTMALPHLPYEAGVCEDDGSGEVKMKGKSHCMKSVHNHR